MGRGIGGGQKEGEGREDDGKREVKRGRDERVEAQDIE